MLSALRHRITLKKPERHYEEGSYTSTYPGIGDVEVWAAVQPLSGPEREQYARLESGVTTRVILRPNTAYSDEGDDLRRSDWRVGIGGRDYEIESVIDPDLRGRMLVLLCYESDS